MQADAPRLVVHLVDRLDAGSVERGLLDLIAHMPPQRYRHAVLCMHDDGGQHARLAACGVDVVSLHQRAGAGLACYLRLYRALRRLQPDVVHSRSPDGFAGQLVAALAGVRQRVHGGYDAALPQPRLRQHLLRRLLRPVVKHFIATSAGLQHWLIDCVGAEPARVSQIANGVDSVQFHPRLGPPAAIGPAGFMEEGAFVIGSAAHFADGAEIGPLIEAFLMLIASPHPAHRRLRLLIVGDGPARAACQQLLVRAGAASRVWLPGARADMAQLMRAMDLYVDAGPGGRGAHGILEAMATGLPVIASACGADLVHPGFTGILVPHDAPDVLAAAIADYCRIPELGVRHGARARGQVIARHSLPAMARSYLAVYDGLAREGSAAML